MAPQKPQPAARGSESSQTTGALSNAPPAEMQQQCRHNVVHSNAANAATENIPLDALLPIICKTQRSKKKKQHAIRCEYIHIMVHGSQLTLQLKAGIHRELLDQFISACNGKPPWLTKVCVRTVREIEQHVVVSPGILVDKFHDKSP